MKSVLAVMCIFAMTVSSCRTTSANIKGEVNSPVDCDPRGFLANLQPGGLFASKRLIYNQVHVQPNIIHPDMVETNEAGALGLFHAYAPGPDSELVKAAMTDLQYQSLSAIAQQSRVVDLQTLAFEGVDNSLNIFSVDAMNVLKVNNFKIDVPNGASTVIIVRGETPAFAALKISGSVNFEKLLFILPEATSFQVRGDKFVGTIIAPKANVNMDAELEGSVFGESVRSMLVTRPFMYSGCVFGKSHLKK